ncbi:MAG: formylglycine-generating enzyme family protein [Acidobacteria bacterium]|nr:formylglycine-generating enzyme family protein [Acidobacteriota bacterium]
MINHLNTFEFSVPVVDGFGRIIKRRKNKAQYFCQDLGGVTLEMIYIPKGQFLMGSVEGDKDEKPQHLVSIPSFFIGKYLITQAQWEVVANWPKIDIDLEAEGSFFKGDDLPVEQVSWYDAIEFCKRLSQKTSYSYRLPSEAEWEYAARAGTTTPFSYGETITARLANFDGNSPYGSARKSIYRTTTTKVGSLANPNFFGLYDIHGNVWEWCQDAWHDNYDGAPIDEKPWDKGEKPTLKVLRGGSWDYSGYGCRSAFRDRATAHIRSPFNGLRVVLDLNL